MSPFRVNMQNLGTDMASSASNPKKRRRNVQTPIQTPPIVQDLLPPPLSGYGDTIVASNPFDDCPSSVNTMNVVRNPNAGGMGMGPNPNMGMNVNNMNMCRPMGKNALNSLKNRLKPSFSGPQMGMGSPLMHSPNTHQNSHMMNNPMMMNGPRMNHMASGPPGHAPHMMTSPNGPGPGPMHPISGPMHSPIGNMGQMAGPGPGNGPMNVQGPMNGAMNNQMNGPPMQGHGHPVGGPGGMQMSAPNGPIGQPMNNNNFMMSPMNNMYSKPMPVSAGKVYPADQPMVFNSQNPNAPPIYPCGVCHKEVHDNDQAILCESGCNFWFHR